MGPFFCWGNMVGPFAFWFLGNRMDSIVLLEIGRVYFIVSCFCLLEIGWVDLFFVFLGNMIGTFVF